MTSQVPTPTLVTALYNINRAEKGDGRKWSEYLSWFAKTLQLEIPMCIFVAKDMCEFVLQHRPEHLHAKTMIYCEALEDIPYAYLENELAAITNSSEYKMKIRHPTRVECILPFYNIIQYSKFPWLLKCAQSNPFNSTHFFWVDAGISRFIDMDSPKRFLDEATINQHNKLIIQHNSILFDYIDKIDEGYLWDSQCLMCGTMFGGDIYAIKSMHELIQYELTTRIKNSWINNEQILLAYVYSKNSDMFHLIHNDSCHHLIIFDILFPCSQNGCVI